MRARHYLLHGAESFLRSYLVLQLIKKFPAFYGTRKFISVLTSARPLSLCWANSIQSPQPFPTSWRSIYILSSHLRLGLPNGHFPSGFPTKTLCTPQQGRKFPPFYGTRRFITAFTSARHLSLSWANSIQSPQPLPTSWRSILILSSHLRLGLCNGKG